MSFFEWFIRRLKGQPDPYFEEAWERCQEERRKLEKEKEELKKEGK